VLKKPSQSTFFIPSLGFTRPAHLVTFSANSQVRKLRNLQFLTSSSLWNLRRHLSVKPIFEIVVIASARILLLAIFGVCLQFVLTFIVLFGF